MTCSERKSDGSIEREGMQGSIHKLGAAAQDAPACNGWVFWHIECEGALTPIDALRQQHVLSMD